MSVSAFAPQFYLVLRSCSWLKQFEDLLNNSDRYQQVRFQQQRRTNGHLRRILVQATSSDERARRPASLARVAASEWASYASSGCCHAERALVKGIDSSDNTRKNIISFEINSGRR